MEVFAAYHPALIVLALWALTLIVLSGLSVSGRTDADLCACGTPRRDYASSVYRRHRAFQNALETSAPFLAASLAAILTGVAPVVVNGLCIAFWVSRVAMAGIHIGTTIQPLRSVAFLIGWLCIVGLALMAILAAL